jgi:hypothetical protein
MRFPTNQLLALLFSLPLVITGKVITAKNVTRNNGESGDMSINPILHGRLGGGRSLYYRKSM